MKSIEFTIQKDGLTYSDAIVFDDDVELSEDEIETIKQQRFDNWYKVITTPVEITEEVIEVTAEE